jgi:hypothetical protein
MPSSAFHPVTLVVKFKKETKAITTTHLNLCIGLLSVSCLISDRNDHCKHIVIVFSKW